MLQNLFKRKASTTESDAALELISLHIPKTAGTSFRNMLKSVYGDKQVVRFDINARLEVRIDNTLYNETTIPEGVRVIHGHFNGDRLSQKFDLSTDVPVITWLRDPVQRVISNYFYLESRLIDLLKEHETNTDIRPKMQKTLLEYASVQAHQNVQSTFTRGFNLEDFHFVGIVEHFSEDTARLAKLLDWQNYQEYHHNATPGKHREVSDEERAQIAAWNDEDMKLYEAGLRLRENPKI